MTALVVLFVLSYFFPLLYAIARLLFWTILVSLIADGILLFGSKGKLQACRILTDKLSNGDENPIVLQLFNGYLFPIGLRIIDEIPPQFQYRNFEIKATLSQGIKKEFIYYLRPTERGEYRFGDLQVFVHTKLGLLTRRYSFSSPRNVPVYPSFLQLKKYDLLAFSNRLFEFGLKKIRRIGHTMEFEQIKEYVNGDDIRNINWKATAKCNQLMINQFQDEKSQPVYAVIDKGRVMKMPFNGLTLLDYAINATLVLSNIILKKNDKAGMFAFSNGVENMVVAERRTAQMNLILETLYNLKTNFVESDFNRLYAAIKRNLNHRSLLLLYTNFETLDALHRQLPYLQQLAKQHLLVVIFFKNSELEDFAKNPAKSVSEIFNQTIAEKFINEKELIVKELRRYGIQTLLTKPEDLTINTINKYLEIKARGMM